MRFHTRRRLVPHFERDGDLHHDSEHARLVQGTCRVKERCCSFMEILLGPPTEERIVSRVWTPSVLSCNTDRFAGPKVTTTTSAQPLIIPRRCACARVRSHHRILITLDHVLRLGLFITVRFMYPVPVFVFVDSVPIVPDDTFVSSFLWSIPYHSQAICQQRVERGVRLTDLVPSALHPSVAGQPCIICIRFNCSLST